MARPTFPFQEEDNTPTIILSTRAMYTESPHRDADPGGGRNNERSSRGLDPSDEDIYRLPHDNTGLTDTSRGSAATNKTMIQEQPSGSRLGLPSNISGVRSTFNSFNSHREISPDLRDWQIFFIIISGTIGLGLFVDSGEILRLAGPGGALLAFALVGFGVLLIMASLAEMINHWPISGALVHFVRAFVDEELSIVLGVAYWFAYCITFGVLLSALVDLGMYWDWARTWQFLTFCIAAPGIALTINLSSVWIYGFVESIAGVVKLLLALGAIITMVVVNTRNFNGQPMNGSKYISDGFKSDSRVTTSPFVATLAGLPIATYAYAGIEIVAVTALEAKKPSSVKWPARNAPWIVGLVYMLTVLGFYLNVSWEDPLLPSMSKRATGGTTTGFSIFIIAIENSPFPQLGGVFNIALIISVFSTANTALYVASRTLYCLAREAEGEPSENAWKLFVNALGTTFLMNKVPIVAVFVSIVVAGWLPILHFTTADQSFQEIISGIATVTIVLVWAAQCLAFIRYRKWLKKCPQLRRGSFSCFSVESLETGIIAHLQPIPAYLGLGGCLATVVGFSTASWWQNGTSASSALAAFLLPGILITSWIFLKAISTDPTFTRFGVVLINDWKALQEVILKLNGMNEREPIEYSSPEVEGWEEPNTHPEARRIRTRRPVSL